VVKVLLALVIQAIQNLFSRVYRVNDRISKNASEKNAVNNLDPSSFGVLYVVATPIGNLADISHRALRVLADVSCVLAEDTRHSKRLFNHYGISTKLRACHEHNEADLVSWVATQLNQGEDLALISDAGTPLISDPGFVIVRALRKLGHKICAVPGASSIIAALSIGGLATDSFVFDGFLPSKSAARKAQLANYLEQSRTILVLESSHRINNCLVDIAEILGNQRRVVIAREITKKFETVLDGTVAELVKRLAQDPDQSRGEFVLMIEGAPVIEKDQAELGALLRVLLAELPMKQASGIAAKITGSRKNVVYELALAIKAESEED
jgi:16S rRNA (cytidine1402-2'-O)-methyltransferase